MFILEHRMAHNPQVVGSNPISAIFFLMFDILHRRLIQRTNHNFLTGHSHVSYLNENQLGSFV